jgi:hypothetical protein
MYLMKCPSRNASTLVADVCFFCNYIRALHLQLEGRSLIDILWRMRKFMIAISSCACHKLVAHPL